MPYITATISHTSSLFAQLRMLRLYLRSRPAARGALQKTVGFGGASYISLSLSTPIKLGEKSSSTMAAQDEHDGAKTQQSPLASQRAEGQVPGRIAKWFPLSASEGFSQWVSRDSSALVKASRWCGEALLTRAIVGWAVPHGDRASRHVLHSLPAEPAYTHTDRLGASFDISLVSGPHSSTAQEV